MPPSWKSPVRISARSALLGAALAFALLCACTGAAGEDPKTPVAAQGILDLSGWDMDAHGPVKLDGEWEVYWGQLLTPKDFQDGVRPPLTGYLRLPSDWSGQKVGGRELERVGQATLRLRILPGPMPREVRLRVFNVKSAFALWLNGKPLAVSGTVGASAATEIPDPSVLLAAFPSQERPMELLLQASNHHFWEAGVIASLTLGSAGILQAEQNRDWAIASFFAGSLLVMGVYHLALHVFRRKSLSPLFFGWYCLLWAGNYVCSEASHWTVRLVFPQAPALLLDKTALICFFLSVPMGYRFFHSLYPNEFSTRLLRLSQALAGGFTVLAFAGSFPTLTTALPAYYLTSSLLIFYCLFMLHRARRSGREGAGFILAGFFILGLAGMNDMLFDLGLIPSTPLISIGMFVFILFQSLALARLFSRAFSAVESLSAELETNNIALQQEMAERAKLASEIVTVSEEERRRLCHDLHDGLCQQLTGARLRCAALERKTTGAGDDARELIELSSLLEDSVSQAYALSRGLWPVEHDPKGVGPSLEELARRVGESCGAVVECSQDLACVECVNEHMVQLYRIAQEAAVNAAKHARPGRIAISLCCGSDGKITLAVRDNGVGRAGAARTKGGLGLRIMAHRARMIGGALSLRDAEGGGTVVECSLLCEAACGPSRREA